MGMEEWPDPVLVFDGDCGFCTSFAGWISARWRRPAHAVAWQRISPSELSSMGLTPTDCRDAAWWRDPSGRLVKGHVAIGRSLLLAGGWERLLGRAILAPVVDPAASRAYRWVARNRNRLPGASGSCAVPSPEESPRG